MTGAKLKTAVELLQSLKEQYPNESEEQLADRFMRAIRGDKAMEKAIVKDAFHMMLREMGKGGPTN